MSYALIPLMAMVLVCLGSVALVYLSIKRHKESIADVAEYVNRIDASNLTTVPAFPHRAAFAPLESSLRDLLVRIEKQQLYRFDQVAGNRILASQLARVYSLVDALGDAVLLLDTRGRIVFANRAMASYLSVDPAEAQQKLASECLVSPSLVQLLKDNEGQGAFHHGRSIELSPEESPNQGHVRAHLAHGFSETGVSVGQILICRDITQIKDAERAQTKFIDSLAEELEGPLSSVNSSLKRVSGGPSWGIEGRSGVNDLIEKVGLLPLMLRNLMECKKLDSGLIELKPGHVPLTPIIEDSIEEVRGILRDRVGGGIDPPVLPHHRTYGSVSGGS